MRRLDVLKSQLVAGDPDAQKEALMLSRKLTLTLNEPANTAVEIAFSVKYNVSQRFIPISAKITVTSKNGPITATELAALSGAEELLIVRVLRLLAASGVLNEVDEKTWTFTPVRQAMATPDIAAGHRMIFELILQAAWEAPQYLRETNYKCPENRTDGLVQYAFQTKLETFKLLISKPALRKDFDAFMGNTMGARNYWILDDVSPGSESPVLIDVGAGKGHDLIALNAKFPGHKSVLQDLQPVIDNVHDLDGGIETMASFPALAIYHIEFELISLSLSHFTPGARVYFYHHILHDWSDYICLEILSGLRSAMKPGYSLLLLHEMIIPEKGASDFHAMLDLTMMAFNSGMERTGRQFRTLLDAAGFEVVNIWAPEGARDADGIEEAMVKFDGVL
ncbi:O-methyltransferase asqD [Lachnellula cervina]|uniref:O-methyltransferase asqD n=1 Tax=Lachnellula cervina TaxID=1316786 RepID=A0A7D8YSU7_9HELO|nr:O-methyltransferase asqD [Lachnellula cervina]